MLSPSQIDARKGKLTASRIACLMRGDAVKIDRLYREMIGEEIEEDLSGVWPVRLGECTEALNAEWYERKNDLVLVRRGEVAVHPGHPWAAATLDAWDDVLACPVEFKHTGGREPLEVVIDRYQPQLQWQMEVTGAKECALSVIFGANEPVVEFIERDADYAAEMVKRGAQFMRCVERRVPPVALEPAPAPADAKRIIDMTGNNSWANSAFTWIETKPHADRCKEAEKLLKAMIEPDVKKAHGHGVQITRDRAGRLSLREQA